MSRVPHVLVLAILTGLHPATGGAAELDDAVPLVRWSGVARRQAFERANAGLDRGLLLDRRIDPSASVDLELANTTNRGVLEALAKESGGVARFVGKTTYVGPPKSAPLRTLIRLRSEELRKRVPRKDEPNRRTFGWDDFSTPRDVLTRLGETFGRTIDGLDAVPHDLWAGAELPDVTFVEAASLVLIQFDLTFEWTGEGGRAVRVVPVPKSVGLESLHAAKGGTPAEFAAALQKRFPEARVEVAGRRVRVFALLETHDAIRVGVDDEGENPREPSPLDRQRFTLRIQDVPASALVKRLEQTGLTFTADAGALRKAGIDLDTKITFAVEDATIDELLRAMCEPLKLDFERRGASVRLTPKSP